MSITEWNSQQKDVVRLLLPLLAAVPAVGLARKVSLRRVYRASPLAFVATILNGVGQNAFFSMGAVYGVEQGLGVREVSVMMMLARSMAMTISTSM